jgi:hypothetical protein
MQFNKSTPPKNMKTLHLRKSIGGSPLRLAFLPILIACFALAPRAQAVVPAPDGGYPGGNTAEGTNALFSLTTGVWNTALGFQALYHDTTGYSNTATGLRALFSNTTGRQNVANGVQALHSNTTGFGNTANGYQALVNNTTGAQNTATGMLALERNTAGSRNTANGHQALFSNTTGNFNTATGVDALYHNTTGNLNTANGYRTLYFNNGGVNTASGWFALYHNTSGYNNTATGVSALFFNTTGVANTANGVAALESNTTGSLNTASGIQALVSNTTGSNNTANGDGALYLNTTGSNNTALGFGAGQHLTTGDYNIDIGNLGVANEGHTIRIGSEFQTRTFIAAIRGVTTGNADAVNVVIDSNGQLGTMSSSRRYKNEIKPMDNASEAIHALKPVTFHYKSDASGTPQFGLIAEEVADVNPNLVVRDENGEIYTVRYEQINAMLLNEFLKEHRIVQEQGATIARQQKQIEALTAGLQKVSAQVEAIQTAPQVVNNP